jgi:toxin ParE1/3/4
VKRRIIVERAAEDDLFESTAYIQSNNPAAAQRFVQAVRDTFERLADYPEMGRRYQTTHPRLQELRIWRVSGFENYLIFYRTSEDTLFIERVLYGTRDIDHLLEEEG